jgi:XTP/dITP diphosphohydrolase
VDALGGEPGVHSARYAGDRKAPSQNIEKLLNRLKDRTNREARFRTVICLMLDGAAHYFTGICEGHITESPAGKSGFGYDPVFIPDGAGRTFAEMTGTEKNLYSHRRKAMDQLVAFLKQQG